MFDAMHAVVADTLLVAEPAFLQKWAQQAREQSGLQLHCAQHCYHLLGSCCLDRVHHLNLMRGMF